MFQDEAVFSAVLAVLTLLVVGLLVTVIVLARSLKANKNKQTAPSKDVAPTQAKQAKPAKASSEEAKAPAVVVEKGAAKGKLPSVRLKAESQTSESDEDLTKVTAFSASKELPRLSVEQDDSAEDSDAGQSFEESIARLVFDSEAEVDIDEPTGPNDLILLSAIGQTDRGVTRRRNEDAYLLDTKQQLFAVADGMGGYAGGDVASRLAIHEMWTAMDSKMEDGEIRGYEDRPRRGRELIAAVERANAAVYRESQTARELHGMGTTLVAARFSAQKQRMYVAHVGDSRCYRFRAGELTMLTKDHTLASRGVIGPLSKNICRALGIAKTVKVDLIVDKPLPDDIILLCSDGLPKMVTDEHIRRILSSNEGQLDRAAAQLVLAANAGGGRDNITVVLVRVAEATKTTRTAALLKSQSRVEFGPS